MACRDQVSRAVCILFRSRFTLWTHHVRKGTCGSSSMIGGLAFLEALTAVG